VIIIFAPCGIVLIAASPFSDTAYREPLFDQVLKLNLVPPVSEERFDRLLGVLIDQVACLGNLFSRFGVKHLGDLLLGISFLLLVS